MGLRLGPGRGRSKWTRLPWKGRNRHCGISSMTVVSRCAPQMMYSIPHTVGGDGFSQAGMTSRNRGSSSPHRTVGGGYMGVGVRRRDKWDQEGKYAPRPHPGVSLPRCPPARSGVALARRAYLQGRVAAWDDDRPGQYCKPKVGQRRRGPHGRPQLAPQGEGRTDKAGVVAVLARADTAPSGPRRSDFPVHVQPVPVVRPRAPASSCGPQADPRKAPPPRRSDSPWSWPRRRRSPRLPVAPSSSGIGPRAWSSITTARRASAGVCDLPRPDRPPPMLSRARCAPWPVLPARPDARLKLVGASAVRLPKNPRLLGYGRGSARVTGCERPRHEGHPASRPTNSCTSGVAAAPRRPRLERGRHRTRLHRRPRPRHGRPAPPRRRHPGPGRPILPVRPVTPAGSTPPAPARADLRTARLPSPAAAQRTFTRRRCPRRLFLERWISGPSRRDAAGRCSLGGSEERSSGMFVRGRSRTDAASPHRFGRCSAITRECGCLSGLARQHGRPGSPAPLRVSSDVAGSCGPASVGEAAPPRVNKTGRRGRHPIGTPQRHRHGAGERGSTGCARRHDHCPPHPRGTTRQSDGYAWGSATTIPLRAPVRSADRGVVDLGRGPWCACGAHRIELRCAPPCRRAFFFPSGHPIVTGGPLRATPGRCAA